MLIQGTVLRNRYQIIEHLGSGGFADTYLAKDRDLPGHPKCVVKNLKPTSPDPAVLPIARRLFETEAQVLYLLGQHDRIPKLFAHFEENSEFYLVQEFVDGHDLSKELVPGKRFSEAEVIELLQEILEILSFVHQRNIIHRDIKPHNLMRRQTDKKIVLIDFGAVKEIGSLAVNTLGQVRSTIAIGTPGYMPYEQANREPRFCSDIYAIGMVAIQALTGLLPQQLLQDPTTGELVWRSYVQVNDKLTQILDKMVRHHFSQRYQSADEVLQAIKSLSPQSKSTLPPLGNTPPAGSFPQPLLLGGLIGLGVAGFSVIALVSVFGLFGALNPTRRSTVNLPFSPSPQSTISTPVSSPSLNFAIVPRFDGVDGFSEGLAAVRVDGKWGYIDKTGNFVIQPQFDDANAFNDGLAIAWISGQNWGFIDKTGSFAISPQYSKDSISNFSENLAVACLANTCGYIDKTGKFVIERKFISAGDFSEDLARVKISDKWGYIDKTGKIVIEPQFDNAAKFAEGLAPVNINGKWGDIDKSAKIVIEPQFDEHYIFSEGLAAIKSNGKWGFIDKTGKVVIQPQYEQAYNFFEGLASVKINGQWGVIDTSGNFIIKPELKAIGSFSEGMSWIESGTKYGYITNPLNR
jgi:serine/threonine protein kinase